MLLRRTHDDRLPRHDLRSRQKSNPGPRLHGDVCCRQHATYNLGNGDRDADELKNEPRELIDCNQEPVMADTVTLKKFEALSPFEIKDELIKLAKSASRTTQAAFLNAGRGNPN